MNETGVEWRFQPIRSCTDPSCRNWNNNKLNTLSKIQKIKSNRSLYRNNNDTTDSKNDAISFEPFQLTHFGSVVKRHLIFVYRYKLIFIHLSEYTGIPNRIFLIHIFGTILLNLSHKVWL